MANKFTNFALLLLTLNLCAEGRASDIVGTLVFDSPSAVVSAVAPQDVVLRLNLAVDSQPLSWDPSAINDGLDVTKFQDWYSISDARLDFSIGCGNNFSKSCVSGGPYSFTFNSTLVGLNALNVAPGAMWSFTLGTFAPSVATVPPGDYRLFSAALGVQITGQQSVLVIGVDGLPVFDDQGLPTFELKPASAYIPLFDTCGFVGDSAAECASPFSRTVATAVPEPRSSWLVMAGLLALILRGSFHRRCLRFQIT